MMVIVGLSHRTAPVEVRESLAIPKDGLPEALRRLSSASSVGEVICISTCNRVEIVAAPRQGVALDDMLADLTGELDEMAHRINGTSVRAHLYRYRDREAALHLFRVAASLDSIVVGEPQILGQVKEAFEAAQAAGTVGPTLSRVISRALHAAKRVRTETAIGEGLMSVSSVAVDLAHQIFGGLAGHKALLVGAGEMAEAAALLLARAGASVLVINRSPERAAELALRVGGSPRPWDELPSALAMSDVVLSSTSSRGFVLPHDMVARAVKLRRGRSLFLIDIAVPRDIEPTVNTLDNVFLYDVDDLEGIVRESMHGRQAEAQKAESIVTEEARGLESWVEARGVTPTIVALRAKVRGTLQAELERSLGGKLRHLGDAERAALSAMCDAAVNKLLHAPTAHLRKNAGDPRGEAWAQTLRELFELPDVAVMADPAEQSQPPKGKGGQKP
jgi:glutamyl-tRNA reductase